MVRSTCSIVLRRTGYKVETVVNGVEAWNALRSRTVDLLITDNQMPYLSGEELILRVRRVSMTLPILGMTTSDNFFSTEAGEQLAGVAWLKKPFGTIEMLNVVRQLLGNLDPRKS